jgi:hypothetical protein
MPIADWGKAHFQLAMGNWQSAIWYNAGDEGCGFDADGGCEF